MIMMVKVNQVLILLLLASLLSITPLLSPSLRHTCIYFIINLLIISLGAEAGLLKAFSKPLDHHQDKNTITHAVVASEASTKAYHDKLGDMTNKTINETENYKVKVVEMSKSEKIAGAAKMEIKTALKKCPSMPSLFFIDVDHAEEDVVAIAEEEEETYYEEEEVVGSDLSGQELFTKAEMFIGNFYKQLKMQREDSWKRIHGFYQKAF